MQKEKFKQTEIGLIPEDWEVQELSEAIMINPNRSLKKGQLTKKVSMDCLDPFTKKIRYFEMSKFSGGSKFKNGDTLFARITPCLENGKTAFVDFLENSEIGFGSTEFIVLSGKDGKTDNNFVYYLAISPELRTSAILSMTGTSGRQRVQIDLLGAVEINLPPLPEQQVIAKILSDLDSKIELNQQMNKTLEEIGKTLFKRWFVDFEFPNEQGKPYKLSGGGMVYNDELKKEIPVGSKIVYLKDKLVFERGIEPGSAVYENKNSGNYLRFIRVSDLNSDISNTFIPMELGTKTCDLENVLLSLDASVGIVKIGYSGAYSTGMRKVYDKQNKWSNGFIYFLLQSEGIQNTINQYAAGTTILHASKSIEFMAMVVPNDDLIKKFNIIVDSVYSKILDNIIENKKLVETRDLLLPKLMSGKIRVKL